LCFAPLNKDIRNEEPAGSAPPSDSGPQTPSPPPLSFPYKPGTPPPSRPIGRRGCAGDPQPGVPRDGLHPRMPPNSCLETLHLRPSDGTLYDHLSWLIPMFQKAVPVKSLTFGTGRKATSILRHFRSFFLVRKIDSPQSEPRAEFHNFLNMTARTQSMHHRPQPSPRGPPVPPIPRMPTPVSFLVSQGGVLSRHLWHAPDHRFPEARPPPAPQAVPQPNLTYFYLT